MNKSTLNKQVFAKRLKELMKDFNETIYTVGEVVHLSPATISRYTNAEMSPKITTIEALARYFKINPTWLLGYNVPKNIEPEEKTLDPYKHNTIAAHLDGVALTEEEEKQIADYIDFLLSKRKK